MLYSVFDWNTKRYRYYEGLGDKFGERPKPVRVFGDDKSHQLEVALSTVPSSAKPVGEGQEPKGRIAVMSNWQMSGLGDSGVDETLNNPLITHPWRTLVLWTGALYLASKAAFWAGRVLERSLRRGRA